MQELWQPTVWHATVNAKIQSVTHQNKEITTASKFWGSSDFPSTTEMIYMSGLSDMTCGLFS